VLPSGHQVNHRIRVTLSGHRTASVTTYTDNKGRFAIQVAGDGTYSLEVQAESGPYETGLRKCVSFTERIRCWS